MKKFLLSLCFLLALSPAACSSIYLFEQFDDTFLLNGWSVVGTDMNIGIATSSDNGNHWHEGWVQNFGATGNHEISQEIATEDMDDLEVAVWIQNYDTKKVYNSHFLFETPNHPFAPEQLTLTKEGNTFTAQWNAPAGNAPTKAVATDNSTWSVDEQDFGSLGLYPNPASEAVYIQGFISKKNMMYNALGQLVKAFGDAQQIPLNDLPDGLYHLVLKAFRDDGVGEETPWVAAMQFAIEHGADVLNMSLGRPKPEPAQKLMMRQACDNALAAGVVAAACAGNVGSVQFMIPVPQNIYTPGDCPPPHLHPDQMVNAGGTSAASPCVAGTIALMLSKNPNLAPAQIDEILENTALKLTEHKNNNFGSGVVDALAAIEAVQTYNGFAENDVKATIYPNPSADVFTIRCEGMRHVEVYSVDGKLMKSQSTTGPQCQISGLDSGVYVVKC